tara:strand:- start:40 stop:255 length:216 start_codon:yes stop_codon:yes gene_type:complete
MLGIVSPILALIGFHIVMIIYLNITNDWWGFGINFNFLKSKYNLNSEGWFAYYIILPLHIIFRVLFKPYNN